MFEKVLRVTLVVCVVLALAPAASGMTMDWVAVGDPGAAADNTGLGYVNYNYNIGKYEVTWAQYAEFLTAVATNSDPYRLWFTPMGSGYDNSQNAGITRSGGGSGPYTYTVKPGMENRPVAYNNWYTAARMANWMTSGNTETGTYEITGGGPNSGTAVIPTASQRATWASAGEYHVLIPSEDEWYKAAYHKKGDTVGGGSNYWDWPNQSNTQPTQVLPGAQDGAAPGSANYWMSGPPSWSLKPTTPVGAYNTWPTVSAYGTFDQLGNVNEVTDRRAPWGAGWNIRPFGGSCQYDDGGANPGGYDEQDPWRDTPDDRPTGYRLAYVGTAVQAGGTYWAAGSLGGGGGISADWGDNHWATSGGTVPGTLPPVTTGSAPMTFGVSGGTVNVASAATVPAGLSFTADNYTISGGTATLTLAGANAAANPITVDPSSVTATISATLGGNGMTKKGDGTLVLSAASNNYGPTIVEKGTLQISSAGALPAGQALTIAAGATVVLSSGLSVPAAGAAAAGSSQAAAVPEPGTIGLLAAGLAGLLVVAWRRRR